MTEKELGKVLLNLDQGSSPADPRQLTRQIVERDRRRVRLLAGLATFFWCLTAAGVLCVCPFYVMVVAPRLQAYQRGNATLADDWHDWNVVGYWAAHWILACIMALLLAAITTVLLIVHSRRATLRQINASLLEISEQIKLLRPPTAAG